MTNAMAAALLMPLCITNLIIITVTMLRKQDPVIRRAFLLFCFPGFFWQLTELLYYRSDDPSSAAYLYKLGIGFVSLTVTGLLYFTLCFYNKQTTVKRTMWAAAYVIPGITLLLSLTNHKHTFLSRSLVFLEFYPSRVAEDAYGIWFWIHSFYCYGLVVLTIGVILVQHSRLPKAYRLPSTLLLLGLVTAMTLNTIWVFRLFGTSFDLTSITGSVLLLFLFVATMSSERGDFRHLARDEIFHYLDQHVLVLDNTRCVTDCNRSAEEWLRGLDLPLRGVAMEQITGRLADKGATLRRTGEEDRGTDLYLAASPPMVYNLRERTIYDKAGRPLGSVVTIMDVTRNRSLIERLEESAGVDSLTGLANRRSYEKAWREMERETPLTVVVCDVYKLKKVNDTLGHSQGDRLLQLISGQLSRSCPEEGRVFRVGGDEFVVLLPGEESRAAAYEDSVKEGLAASTGSSFLPTVTMGWAVKRSPDQDYREVFEEADRALYQEKGRELERETRPTASTPPEDPA